MKRTIFSPFNFFSRFFFFFWQSILCLEFLIQFSEAFSGRKYLPHLNAPPSNEDDDDSFTIFPNGNQKFNDNKTISQMILLDSIFSTFFLHTSSTKGLRRKGWKLGIIAWAIHNGAIGVGGIEREKEESRKRNYRIFNV